MSAASTEFIPFYYAAYGNYIESGHWSGLADSGIAIISKGSTSNRDCLVLPVYVINDEQSTNLFVTLYTNVGQISQEIELIISGANGDISYSPYSVIDSSQLSNIASGYHIITFNVPFSGNFFRIRWNSDIGTEVVCIVSESIPSSGVNSDVIQAIQDQTSDLQQSIEDQYSGDPDQSFNIDDIVTQHNEKMGVLSFSSDVMMDLLGLLSPDQNLSSELVFPSMSLKIANQRQTVQLWPEYRFDLEELAGHWPFLINLMRSITTSSVWLLVLRYCYNVFDKYFLAGGS